MYSGLDKPSAEACFPYARDCDERLGPSDAKECPVALVETPKFT